MKPFVKIKHSSTTAYTSQVFTAPEKKSFGSNNISIDINEADTTAFIALPGIGSKLAQRIINFRTKLGGFYSIDQVRETFGLPDSTFRKIQKQLTYHNSTIQKININALTIEARDGLFEGNIRVYVHDKDELDELVIHLKRLPGIESVSG